VWREQLDVLVEFPPVHFVLDAVVGKVDLLVKVRQIVLARPVADLVLVAAWSAVAVRMVAIVVLQELLVLALQVLFEDDASDLEAVVLVSKTGFLLAKRGVEIRVVVDLSRATDAGVNACDGSPSRSSECESTRSRPSLVRVSPRSLSPRSTSSTSL
jgi:hypothetical protein